VKEPGKEKIVGGATTDGKGVRFDSSGARLSGNTLQASVNGAPYQIALDRVQRFWVERKVASKARTNGLIIGVTAGAFVATVATETCWPSCRRRMTLTMPCQTWATEDGSTFRPRRRAREWNGLSSCTAEVIIDFI
jgi:hypothetical protein